MPWDNEETEANGAQLGNGVVCHKNNRRRLDHRFEHHTGDIRCFGSHPC